MPYKTTDFRPQGKVSPAPFVEKTVGNQTVYFRITTVAPLHIGCDEVYEPTAFVIDMKTRELVSFETASFLEQLDSDALGKFSAICKKGTIVSLLELLKFMRSQADLAEGQRIRVPEAFIKHYESTLNLPQNERTVGQELNSFQIKRTAFDTLTGNAYIPGSAIKGAVRTAVLNLRNQGKSTPRFQGNGAGRKLQEQLLDFQFNHLESDPFRLIKVSDFFPVNDAVRAITYAVDKKKKPNDRDAQAPYQILETVEAGAEFIGSITVLSSPGRAAEIRQPVSLDEITKALTYFYGAEKLQEDVVVKGIGVLPSELAANGKSFPLRIGRHSGAECVTVSGHRKIKIKQGGGRPAKEDQDHATTIWLAAEAKKPTTNQGMKPFGWARFEQLAFEEGEHLREKAERKKAAALEGLKEKISARKKFEEEQREKEAAQQRKDAEEAARLATEAAAKQAAAEHERQTLAAMSEVERDVYTIEKAGTPDEVITNIYKKLDGLNPEDQKTIAMALKNSWESNNIWLRNQCIPAQWEKVKKVKTYLATEPATDLFTPEEQAVIERIDKFANWGDWQKAGIAMEALPLAALKKLREKFNTWKIKDGKGDKPATWKTINRLIQQTTKQSNA